MNVIVGSGSGDPREPSNEADCGWAAVRATSREIIVEPKQILNESLFLAKSFYTPR
jgi:hypothetical protein